MRITLCALSKILELTKPEKVFRIQVTAIPFAGQHVDLYPDEAVKDDDCIICTSPKVVADLETATVLADQTIDFSFDTEEFVISNRGNE
jgi:Fe-S cluster assembly iron-binding protein IscA